MRVGRKENILLGWYEAGVFYGEADNEKSNPSGVEAGDQRRGLDDRLWSQTA